MALLADDRVLDPTLACLLWLDQNKRLAANLWVPLLLELKPGKTAQDFVGASQGLQQHVRVPALYRDQEGVWAKSRYLTARMSLAAVNRLLLATVDPWAPLLARYEIGRPQFLDESRAPMPPWPLHPSRPDEEVVVAAVIDDSIAFAHTRFRTAQFASRFDWLWDQRGEMAGSGDYGRLYRRGDIDALIGAHLRGGIVDESGLYRDAGYERFGKPGTKSVSKRVAHGTHVADLAFGGDFGAAESILRRIAVQLPREVTADTTGSMLAPYALDALRTIQQYAKSLGKTVRGIVVNLSYGIYQGPHDGTGLLESALDELIQAAETDGTPLHLVLPTGNHRQARCHARDSVPPGQSSERLVLRVLPDDRTPSLVELWTDAACAVELLDPSGQPAGSVGPGQNYQDPGTGGERIRIDHAGAQPNGRQLVTLRLGPTARDGGFGRCRDCITPGLWKVRVTNLDSKPMEVKSWIARDEAPMNWPRRGRQTRFEDPRYPRWTTFDDVKAGRSRAIGELREDDPSRSPSVIRRRGTLSGIATGKFTFVVSGVRGDRGKATLTGALGEGAPGRPGTAKSGKRPQREIDYFAWSEDSAVRRGVLAAGSRSAARVRLGGTSVAAPQVSRMLIERLLAGEAVQRPTAKEANATKPIHRP